MWLRALLFAATAVAGGAVIGRSAVDKAVKSRVSQSVEIAKTAAIEELSRETTSVVRQKVLSVAVSLLWKAAIISALFALHEANDLTERGFQLIVIIITSGFAIRDIMLMAPHIWRGYVYVRGHDWKPATALKEFIARIVFDRAYEKAIEATSEPGARQAIALSSYTKEALSEEVALAVSDVARTASIRIIRLRVLLGLAIIAAVSGTYSAFIYFALSQT